jgi:four helix bundle protein
LSHKYQDLIVWQEAKAVAVEIYRVTEGFPKAELYGLTSQMRRSAVSVPSSIAEGQGRLTKGEFAHFLGQARGSLLELETQLAIALELDLVSKTNFDHLLRLSTEVQKLLNGLIDAVRVRANRSGNSKPETGN